MKWNEFQDLHLEHARVVGAEFGLRVEPAEPESIQLQTEAYEFKLTAIRRWGFSAAAPSSARLLLPFTGQTTRRSRIACLDIGQT